MSRYIGQYVSTYDLCLRTKPIRQAPVGELHPFRIPDSQWNMLSVDFVVELPCEGDQSSTLQEIPQLNYTIGYVTTYLQEIPQRIR